MRSRSEIDEMIDIFSPGLLYMIMYLAVSAAMEAVWTYVLQEFVQKENAPAQVYAMQMLWNCLCLVIPAAAGCLFVRKSLFRELRAFSEKYPFFPDRKHSYLEDREYWSIDGFLGSAIPVHMLSVLMTATASLAIAVNVLFSLLMNERTDPVFRTVSLPGLSGFMIQAMIFGICIPLIEEGIFRGILFPRLERVYGLFPAVLVSSALFGIYHAAPAQGIYAFVMGIVFAVSYAGTGRFSVPFGLHGLSNMMILMLNQTGAYAAVCAPWWDAALFAIAGAGFYSVFRETIRGS